MRQEYQIGDTNNMISLEATIGTPGISKTIVYHIVGPGNSKTLVESDASSGSISNHNIGIGSDLTTGFVRIRTSVDFGSIDSSLWSQLYNSLIGKYKVSGGAVGNKSYSYDDENKSKSSSGQFVVVDMEISFKS